jgi:excisionase family DNA binding protein
MTIEEALAQLGKAIREEIARDQSPPPASGLMTVRDACEVLSLSRAGVNRLMKSGDISSRKVQGRRLLVRADVERIVAGG